VGLVVGVGVGFGVGVGRGLGVVAVGTGGPVGPISIAGASGDSPAKAMLAANDSTNTEPDSERMLPRPQPR